MSNSVVHPLRSLEAKLGTEGFRNLDLPEFWIGLARRSSEGAKAGGASRDRTGDLKLAKLALSQLSYGPDLVPREIRARRIGGPGKI